MERKIKLLVTTIGSLVGHNMQDIHDYLQFRRKGKVDIIGTNSIPISPNNFRCDK